MNHALAHSVFINLRVLQTGRHGEFRHGYKPYPATGASSGVLLSELTAIRGELLSSELLLLHSLHLISLLGSSRRQCSRHLCQLPKREQMCSWLSTGCLRRGCWPKLCDERCHYRCGCSYLHVAEWSVTWLLDTQRGTGEGEAYTSWLKPFWKTATCPRGKDLVKAIRSCSWYWSKLGYRYLCWLPLPQGQTSGTCSYRKVRDQSAGEKHLRNSLSSVEKPQQWWPNMVCIASGVSHNTSLEKREELVFFFRSFH